MLKPNEEHNKAVLISKISFASGALSGLMWNISGLISIVISGASAIYCINQANKYSVNDKF